MINNLGHGRERVFILFSFFIKYNHNNKNKNSNDERIESDV